MASDDEDERMQALCDDFEELCRQLRYHQKDWCVRNPAYSYQGPPPVSLAERLEALARDARDVSEEDAEVAEEMARQVRDEAEAGAAEAARKAAMEARIEAREAEAEKARAAEREATREAERRAAASAAAARTRSDSSAVSAATARRRRAATAAASRLPTLFDLEALPDSVASLVLREMGDYELAATMCASRRFRRIATMDDELWGFVQRKHRRWPLRPERGETHRAAFQRGVLVDAGWRRARFDKTEHRAHSEYAQCVALRGDVFVSGSADKTLAVVGLPPRAPEPELSESENDDETEARFRARVSERAWERVLGRAVGHADAVTCCRLTGGDAADGGAPTTLFSGDARGEMRVWDLRRAPVDPWERVAGNASASLRESDCHSVPCVSSHLLSSPDTGLPHAQFFDVRDDQGLGAGGLAACASDRAGAGVHVYDCARFGAAIRRFELGAAAYGVAWGGGGLDRHVVHVACDDGVVRRWDARDNSGRPCDASARVEAFSKSDHENPGASPEGSSSDAGQTLGGEEPGRLGTEWSRRSSAARCVSADGDTFAFGSARGTVHVRDARKPSAPLCAASEAARWHDDCVNAVAVDAKLRRVVSGGDDGYVRWRRLPLSGNFEGDDGLKRATATPPALFTGVGALAVAFDHSRVVVGCVDTTVRAYDAVTGEDFVDADALREAWREVCLRARDAGNLLERPVMSGGELAASLDWGNYRP